MKAIHVQLTYEGGYVGVLEVLPGVLSVTLTDGEWIALTQGPLRTLGLGT